MPEVSRNYSRATPYACATGRHFSSRPIFDCESCKINVASEEYPCVSGRHFYRSRYDAASSVCCKPFIIDVPALEKEKRFAEARLPALDERVSEISSKLQKFKDLKSDLEKQIAAKKNARAEVIARGEVPSGDLELPSLMQDVPTVDGHIHRESAALDEAKGAATQCRWAISLVENQLNRGSAYAQRDQIHSRMAELLVEWNCLVGGIINLRREHEGLSLGDGGLNGPGHYPILPPGFWGGPPEKLRPIYFLRPELNVHPQKIEPQKEVPD